MTIFDDDWAATVAADLAALHGVSVMVTLDGAAQKTITARWSPQECLVSYFPDGSQEVARGVLRVNPADWSPVTLQRDQAVIAGKLYALVQTGTLAPVLELQLVARATQNVQQDARTVKR